MPLLHYSIYSCCCFCFDLFWSPFIFAFDLSFVSLLKCILCWFCLSQSRVWGVWLQITAVVSCVYVCVCVHACLHLMVFRAHSCLCTQSSSFWCLGGQMRVLRIKPKSAMCKTDMSLLLDFVSGPPNESFLLRYTKSCSKK